MFQESQPYHLTQMTKGQRFEIYMQAFRVIDTVNFLQEAKLLYLAMPKKSEAGWDTVEAMFAALLAGEKPAKAARRTRGKRVWWQLLPGPRERGSF
jgi:hypothetical protein